jgi:outer membrane receptor protein involved in Fe transport
VGTVGVAHGKQRLDAVYPSGATVGTRDLVTGVRSGSPDVLQKRAPSWNTNVGGSLSWFVADLKGRHDVKVGAEYTQSKVVNEMFSVGDHNLRVNSGVPAQVVFFDTPAVGDARIDVSSAYVQDSWVIGNKLTLNVGLRYDRFVPHREASQAGGGTWAGTSLAETYPILNPHEVFAIDPQWRWNSFSPRAAASYSMNERTVLRASFSRYYHFVNTGMIPGGDENAVTSLTVQWNDLNSDRRFQLGEDGRLLSFAEGVSRVRFDADIQHPFTDEYVVGVSRELLTDFSINANFIWRRDDDLIHTVQVGIPDSSYTPVGVVDPGEDGRIGTPDDGTLTVFAQNPATFGQEVFLETNPNKLGKDNGRDYTGFEFVANKRLSNRWQFVGSLVIQDMESLTPSSSFYTTGLFQNPNDQVNARGRDPLSETVLVKFQGIYQGPWGLLFSGYYRFGSGQPIARTLVVRGLPQGTITVLAEKRGERETPDNNLLDFRVEKSFGLGADRRLSLGIDIFNLLNASTVTSQGVSTGVDLGVPRIIVNPRIARLGVRFLW